MLMLVLILVTWITIDTTGGAGAPPQVRTPTYSRDVSRILQQRCVSCHRTGDIAPFALDTLSSAREHAEAIKAATASRQMPPWMPSECCGTFKGARRLPESDIAILAAWADAGAPEGDPQDLPPPLEFDGRWTLGTPDRVLTMPEPFTPVSARDMYRCFPIPSGLMSPAYLSAIDVQPGSRSLVHHAAVYVVPSDVAARRDASDPEPGYPCFGGPGVPNPAMIGGWGPGSRPMRLPDDIGIEVPADATLILQVHYAGRGHDHSPNATASPDQRSDQSSIGLYLASEKPAQLLQWMAIVNTKFAVPPGESDYEVRAAMRTPAAARIWGVAPHMHLLGKRVGMNARLPDGSVTRLIQIDRWNFNWQGTYMFEEPLDIPAGTELSITAVYDNSSANPRNPNTPPRLVSVGEATTDEMCVGVVAITWTEAEARPGAELIPVVR